MLSCSLLGSRQQQRDFELLQLQTASRDSFANLASLASFAAMPLPLGLPPPFPLFSQFPLTTPFSHNNQHLWWEQQLMLMNQASMFHSQGTPCDNEPSACFGVQNRVVGNHNVGETSSISSNSCNNSSPQRKRKSPKPWSVEEQSAFLAGMEVFGRSWKDVSREFVPTRTPMQLASHAQKYFDALRKQEQEQQRREAKREYHHNHAESENDSNESSSGRKRRHD